MFKITCRALVLAALLLKTNVFIRAFTIISLLALCVGCMSLICGIQTISGFIFFNTVT